MSERKITCAEADHMRRRATGVASSLTDILGRFGPPRIETTWHRGGVEVLRDVRHPAWPTDDLSIPSRDRLPCEHYAIEDAS